jgi:probable phosphoglycerate mutase
LGRQQSERLRDRWAGASEFQATALVSSQYARAVETAEIIAPVFGGLAIVHDDGFGEHDPGPQCDGLSYTEFTERFHMGGDLWDSQDPFATTFPGGETVAAFQFRVGASLRRLLDAHSDGTVVVVCHGGVIDAVLRLALKTPGVGVFQIHTLNTSITELELVKPMMWRLVRYNDAAHLTGLPTHTTQA